MGWITTDAWFGTRSRLEISGLDGSLVILQVRQNASGTMNCEFGIKEDTEVCWVGLFDKEKNLSLEQAQSLALEKLQQLVNAFMEKRKP